MTTKMTLLFVLVAVAALIGCGEKKDGAEAWNDKAADTAATGTAAADPHAAPAQPQAVDAGQPGGEVLETFDSGGYTYVRLQTADGEIWAAGPVAKVSVGDKISLAGAMVMKNFTASSLNRTFEEIWFASGLDGAEAAAAPKATASAPAATPTDFSGIHPAQGGATVASVHADRTELAGKHVKVRGKVVKALSGIMGRNWLHLQDGTGEAGDGTNDLTITSDQTARVGDTVLVDGVVAVDKDFGSGYFYTVIVEEAKVIVEEAI